MEATPEAGKPEALNVGRAIALHLLPGAIGTIAYIILAPILLAQGLPALLALLIAALLVIAPIELGILFYVGRKRNDRLSLKGIVLYREPMPWWQYPAIVLPLLVWGFLATGLAGPLDNSIGQALFGWLPQWAFISDLDQWAQFSPAAVVGTLVFSLGVNGVILPYIEELYFRGYLLPRLEHYGAWAPWLNGLLFSLYHFWLPWQNISRLLFVWPLSYAGWRKRNIRITIIAHIAANLIGGLLTLGLITSRFSPP